MESLADTSVGRQLRQKREEQRLTLEEVANQLRLSRNLIEDIEEDKVGTIPLTYLKGYLRSYAKLVALPNIEIFLQIETQNTSDTLTSWKIFSDQKQISSGDRIIQWITYCIVSILVLLVILWWRSDNLLYKNLSINDIMPTNSQYNMADNSPIANSEGS
jgi:cytoskeleton protein RodZ